MKEKNIVRMYTTMIAACKFCIFVITLFCLYLIITISFDTLFKMTDWIEQDVRLFYKILTYICGGICFFSGTAMSLLFKRVTGMAWLASLDRAEQKLIAQMIKEREK